MILYNNLIINKQHRNGHFKHALIFMNFSAWKFALRVCDINGHRTLWQLVYLLSNLWWLTFLSLNTLKIVLLFYEFKYLNCFDITDS